MAELQNLQSYVEECFKSENCRSPTPPDSNPNSELQEIWEAICELKATTWQHTAFSAPPPPTPDLQPAFELKLSPCKWLWLSLFPLPLILKRKVVVLEKKMKPKLSVQELSTQITGVRATSAVQQIQIDNALQVSIASRDSGVQQATTLNTLKESTCQLWTMQPPVESEAEFILEVHVLNSKLQDSSNGFANAGIDPNYKLSFKQVFDPRL
ncbi:hypothetical protein DSO57_1010048 [Entomophthora muscae]|uniref:Uncharacterized protein n=1 Tax=Entomophthora muscae TaxID=34485 RepID=A0ACC2TUS6_9FUNG|nr:hypothetical protein DSO57_1010048 [Entomophthora muscae]